MSEATVKRKASSFTLKRRRQFAFYMAILIIPIIQFCIFYVYVNFNSIALAFKKYTSMNEYEIVWFDNFVSVFTKFTTDAGFLSMLKNTFLVFALSMVIGTFFPVMVSYYMYKKKFFWGFFRIILFLPSVLSSMALVTMYRGMVVFVIPEVFGVNSLLSVANEGTRFAMVLFYNFWFGFGTSFLIYTGSMCAIPESIPESASLDGVTPMQEFFKITLPLIFPTFVTYLVVNIGLMFSNQVNLYSFFGTQALASERTIGYYLYQQTVVAGGNVVEYPELSAFGLIATMIALPLSLGVKWLLNRFGPSTER